MAGLIRNMSAIGALEASGGGGGGGGGDILYIAASSTTYDPDLGSYYTVNDKTYRDVVTALKAGKVIQLYGGPVEIDEWNHVYQTFMISVLNEFVDNGVDKVSIGTEGTILAEIPASDLDNTLVIRY